MQQSIKIAEVILHTNRINRKTTFTVVKKEYNGTCFVTVAASRPFNTEEAAKNEAKRFILGIEVESSVKPAEKRFYYITQRSGGYSMTNILFEHKVGTRIQHNGEWQTIIFACTDKQEARELWADICAKVDAQNKEVARAARAARRSEYTAFLNRLFSQYGLPTV